MRKILFILLLGLIFSSNALAGRIIDEKSQFGKFEVVGIDEGCKILFHHNNGITYELITDGACTEEDSLASIGPDEEEGGMKFPVKTSCGEEVHLFSALTHRGGNACGGYTYWVAFITRNSAWASGEIGDCSELQKITIEKKDGKCILSLYDNPIDFIEPNLMETERKYQVQMGGQVQTKVKKRVLKVSSKRIVKVIGIYQSPIHATSYCSSIKVGGNYYIFHMGKCNEDELEDGDKVKAQLLYKTWENGHEEVICLSIIRISSN